MSAHRLQGHQLRSRPAVDRSHRSRVGAGRASWAALTALVASLALVTDSTPVASQGLELEQCPISAPPTTFESASLDALTAVKDGVVYTDAGGVGRLRLAISGGEFRAVAATVANATNWIAAGDFNEDGWDDFVGVSSVGRTFVYRNNTVDNVGPSPDWSDPSFTVAPKFDSVLELVPAPLLKSRFILAVGDFNGDGKPDVFRADSLNQIAPLEAWMWLNTGKDASDNPTFGARYAAMAADTVTGDLGQTNHGGTNVAVLDYNGDRKLDVLIGGGDGTGGSTRIFLNTCTLVSPPPATPAGQPLPCADAPKFSYAGDLLSNMNMGGDGNGELPVLVFTDFDGDGNKDLIAGSPLCCADPTTRLQIWRGIAGGGVEPTPSQSIDFIGAATAVLAADFSLDGRSDLIVGTDNKHYGASPPIGGRAFYYENDGTTTPFPSASELALLPARTDFDTGAVLNYDNDPDGTPDVILTDGDNSKELVVFANRAVTEFVDCGVVESGIVDLGALSGTEMVITSARMTPTVNLNGGSVTFYLSNEDPPNWVLATPCPDDATQICATFPKPTGRELRWKAEMCSDATHTQSPEIVGLDMTFDYAEAAEHYRAGVITHDGVAYVGAFSQPGERGQLYAFNAGLSERYWSAGELLDAMNDGDRKIYTTALDGTTRLDFTVANAADPDLQATLQTTDATQTSDVVSWIRSARFGVDSVGITKSRLGAVETSTPAIIPAPGLPIWYTLADSAERAAVDQFISDNADRDTLVLFGSKDGMIHALRNDATNISAIENGTEAWAYIPPTIARGMLDDFTQSASGTLQVSAYPDGSPTVADAKLADGDYHTIAIVGSGNGGKSVATLDITQTIDPVSKAVLGPTPLWQDTPGGPDAGQSFVKPAIARVQIGGAERFVVITGTGIDFTDTPPYDFGRVVVAYDASDGSALWKFKTMCPVTSDIAVFETDDDLEPGAPEIDGYMDRAVFADRCGYVYKVNPALDLGGGWNVNAGLGAIETEDLGGGDKLYALFSTTDTANSLGFAAPIAGTLGARTDVSQRMILFFGTGGLEDHDPNLENHFYAVFADTGAIRSKLVGECSAPSAPRQCDKFYGGVVVTTQQVIFSRSKDPVPGTGTCDTGSAVIEGLRLNANADDEFDIDFTQVLSSAAVGALYGDAGALYIATITGEVVRIGTPRATEAGGDSAASAGGGVAGGGGTLGTNEPMVLMGWRQVY